MTRRATLRRHPAVLGAVAALALAAGAHTTTYTVRSGDTLSEIAAEHGVTTRALADANGIRDLDRIRVGATLRLPPGAGPAVAPSPDRTHVIAAGETLGAIAARHRITVAALARANRLADPNRIPAGATLRVPAYLCPVAATPWFQDDWGAPRPAGRWHQGNDLFAPRGTAVLAPVAGRVEHVRGPVGGLQFVLHGDDGRIHIGTHLASFGRAGRVAAGTVLGRVGTTGSAEGTQPHLHLELHTPAGPANPYPVLTAACR